MELKKDGSIENHAKKGCIVWEMYSYDITIVGDIFYVDLLL